MKWMKPQTSDMGWTRYADDMEKLVWRACYEASLKAGYTRTQAEKCDAGSLKCPECPWRVENKEVDDR